MNDEFVKVTLTFPMRCDRPNRNSTVFTKEAIQNAFSSSDPQMPIVGQSSMRASEHYDRCIGITTPAYYLDYDEYTVSNLNKFFGVIDIMQKPKLHQIALKVLMLRDNKEDQHET